MILHLLRPGLGIHEHSIRVKRKVTLPSSPKPYPETNLQVEVVLFLPKTESFNSEVNKGKTNKQNKIFQKQLPD